MIYTIYSWINSISKKIQAIPPKKSKKITKILKNELVIVIIERKRNELQFKKRYYFQSLF